MKVSDVEKDVAEIEAMKRDDEMAHSFEDALYEKVLIAIRDREPGDDPADLAKAALKTQEIEFARWCA